MNSQAKRIISLSLLSLIPYFSFSQDFFDKLQKGLKNGNNILREGNNMVRGVGQLSTSVTRTTKEFNKSVRVVRGNDDEKIGKMSSEQLTQLKIKNGKVKNLDWEPYITAGNQLFPSSIITLSGYRGATTPELESIIRPIGFEFKSKNSNIPIKWEIESVDKRFFDKISGNCLYDMYNEKMLRNPEIPWNIEALAKQNSSTPINIIFRIFDENNNKVEKTVSAYMRSVDDCIRYYNGTPLLFLYTAYIQEEHPEIRKILKEATDTKIVSSIEGYHGNVDRQIAAIWKVLHDRGINYGTITTTAGGNNKSEIVSQVVRTFDKSINDRQANCVDGTVVLASILRKMGIHSALMIVKGHCFLKYYRKDDDKDGNRRDPVYLETTILDAESIINSAKDKARLQKNKKKSLEIINQGYIKQFEAAQRIAFEEYQDFENKKEIYDIIDVDLERQHVTKPIPFYSN